MMAAHPIDLSGSRPNVPARRRLHRIRWTMTLFFAVTTAGCLIVLGVFAAVADSGVRHRTDEGLLTQAKLFSVGVETDGQGFSFQDGTSSASGAGLSAIGSVPAGFIDSQGIAYATPTQAALPSSKVIDQLYASAARNHTAVYTTADADHGRSYRWVALPIGTAGTAIVLVGAPATTSFSHGALVSGLVLAVVILVLLATIAGHVLSDRVMRPALRQVEQQEQFLREAAHEIRTPLTTLTLIAESGLRNPDTARDSLQGILDRLSRMNTVVSTLLLRARTGTGAYEVEKRPLRLDQLVEVTIGDLNRGDRVTVSATPTVITGNSDLLAQAIRNLVENAIRHGGNSPVHITVRDGTLTVSGSGPGLPASGNESLAHPGSRSTAGTGTGLAIVVWVAEIHSAEFHLTQPSGSGVHATLQFATTER
jgi:two-component system OmpR family sensor kinase